MTMFKSLIPIALLITAGISAQADSLTGDAGTMLQPWSQATLGTAANPTFGGPYWNNKSGDTVAGSANIGWCLTGAGGCAIASPPQNISYYGDGTAAPSNMFFTSNGGQVTMDLLAAYTSQMGGSNGIDYMGYYTVGTGGTLTPHQLLSASSPNGTMASFSLTSGTNYGFYIENVQGQGTVNDTDYWFFMNSAANAQSHGGVYSSATSYSPGLQHAAVFDQTDGTSYYIGLEDTFTGTLGDADYNDMVLQMSVAPTVSAAPEPVSTALAGLGLVAFGLVLRRKLHKKV